MARLTPRRRGTMRSAATLPLLASLALTLPLYAQQSLPAVPTPSAPASPPVVPVPVPSPVPVTPSPGTPTPGTPSPAPAPTAPPPAIPTPGTSAPAVPGATAPAGPASGVPAPAALAPAAALPVTPVPPPASGDAPVTPESETSALPLASGRDNSLAAAPGSAHNLLSRLASEAMGKNNGVRLWVKGDGSGATLRVCLSRQHQDDTPESTPLRPNWVSAPLVVSFTGWKQILLPKSKFNLHAMPETAMGINMALPADVQVPTPGAAAADWKKINAVTLETHVARRAGLVIDDVSWVTIDPQGAITDETSVDDFEKGNVAAWKPGGPTAEQNSLVYRLATLPGQVHGGRVAFRWDVTSPAAMREVSLAAFKKTLTLSGKPYAVFAPASLFDPVLPTSLPPAGGSSSLVSVRACPDQIQAATFCVYSQKPLSNVSVSIPNDLQALGHVFPRVNVDVRVVKVWMQSGAGPLQDPDAAALVPELLVKDDRVPLTGATPAARLIGAPATNLPADTTKQFWVTFTVPRNTFPARYTGSLRITATGLSPAVVVPMDLTVLPLRLMSPAKQYAINLRSRLDTPPATLPSDDGHSLVTDFVSKDTLDKQLADIYAHGIRIPTLYDSPEMLGPAVAEYRQYGMGEPYVYRGDGEPLAVEAARKQTVAAPFVFYDGDTPLSATGPRMTALTDSKLVPTSFLTTAQDYDAVQSVLGLAIYNRDSPYAQQLVRTKGLRTSSTRDWWYWPASAENPLQNRLDAGYLLWRANLYGAFIPEYQTAFGTDPYDETSAGAPPFLSAYRPQMLTYPAQGGVIDTLQWEAIREGITDVRYLTTMYAALRECKDVHIAKPLVDQAEAYAKAFLDKPLTGLPEPELDKARTQIAAYALQLRTAVDTYNKQHGIKP